MAFGCNGSNGALTGTPSGPSLDGGAGEDGDASSSFVTSNDAPGSLIVDTAPPIDTFVPLNSFDGSDRPEGGAPLTPGVIGCELPTTCNEFAGDKCCVSAGGGSCVVEAGACPAESVVVTCNEADDCRLGSTCCGTVTSFDGGFTSIGAQCAASCAPAPKGAQLCRTSAECPDGGPCVVQGCSDGNRYELCGVYTSPPDAGFVFNCAPL